MASTWGSKRKRGKNVWEIRYSIAGERRTETFHGTERQADRRLAELRIKYEGLDEDITLNQFWEKFYYPEILERLAASTVSGYERTWRKDIKPTFGEFRLNEISPRDVQKWLLSMTKGKAKHAKSILSAILSRAFAENLIEDNPVQRRFVMPKGKATRGQRTKEVYNAAELNEIFNECHGEKWEAAFILSAFGGASREEAMSPKVNEIHLRKDGFAVVPIVRGVQRLDGEVVVFDWTKTEERRREIIIEPPYSKRLKKLADDAKKRGDTWLTDNGEGMPMCPDLMANKYWKHWFLGRSIKYIPFSNLRNSYATVMSQRDINPIMVSKMMGHTNLTTTYMYYNRPSTDDKIAAVKRSVGNCGQK